MAVIYQDAAGRRLLESEAFDGDGKLRSGVSASLSMLRPGERLNFDLSLMDRAPNARGDTAMTHQTSLDRQTADHNNFLRFHGMAPVHVTDGVRAASDQVAREGEEKRRRNNAFVDSLVADRQRQTAALIGDTAAHNGSRALRDAARAGQYE